MKARYVGDHTIHVWFADGTGGDVDLGNELYGEVFDPLKEPVVFKTFTVHPDSYTLCWPNGADIAPEFLYEKVQPSVWQEQGIEVVLA